MKKIKYLFIFIVLLTPFFIFAEEALISSGDDVLRIIQNVTNWFWKFFAIVTVFAFLLAAFFYVTAGGDTKKIEKANGMIKYGIIGVVVAILAGSVVPVIQSIIAG